MSTTCIVVGAMRHWEDVASSAPEWWSRSCVNLPQTIDKRLQLLVLFLQWHANSRLAGTALNAEVQGVSKGPQDLPRMQSQAKIHTIYKPNRVELEPGMPERVRRISIGHPLSFVNVWQRVSPNLKFLVSLNSAAGKGDRKQSAGNVNFWPQATSWTRTVNKTNLEEAKPKSNLHRGSRQECVRMEQAHKDQACFVYLSWKQRLFWTLSTWWDNEEPLQNSQGISQPSLSFIGGHFHLHSHVHDCRLFGGSVSWAKCCYCLGHPGLEDASLLLIKETTMTEQLTLIWCNRLQPPRASDDPSALRLPGAHIDD